MNDNPAPEKPQKVYDAQLARRLLHYLRPYAAQLGVALLLLFAGSALELLGPYLIKVGIDDHIAHGDVRGLWIITLVYVGSRLAFFGLRFTHNYITQVAGQNAMFDLRAGVFEHLQRMPLRYFDKRPVGQLMTRVTSDVQALHELFSTGVVTILGDLFIVVGVAVAMFLLDWRLALVVLALLPLLTLTLWQFKGLVREAYRQTRAKLAEMNALAQETITGIRVVQLFGRERQHRDSYETINAGYRDAYIRSVFYYAAFIPVADLLQAAGIALIVWYGGFRAIEGTIQVGVLVAFISYSRRFFWPIRNLTERYNVLQAAMAASERIFALLDEPEEIGLEPAAPALQPGQPSTGSGWRQDAEGGQPRAPALVAGGDGANGSGARIEFRDVHFSYVPGEPVLEGVSFAAEPGERVAIVGPTGAGKTTITSLLGRFYEIERGAILVDDIDTRDQSKPALRAQLAIVLQDPFIFSDTVLRNITLGDESVSREQAEAAARHVNADRFIRALPQGYNTPLGERGALLSGGQRQLIAFARALAADPHILVLDEATSSVDTETELLIQDALAKLMAGRTSLVIAHRLSTIHTADKIVVLQRGRVREFGTHEELLTRGGLYAKLYELQFGDADEVSRVARAVG